MIPWLSISVSTRKRFLAWVKQAIGISILVVIVLQVDLDALQAAARSIDVRFFLFAALTKTLFVITTAMRWRIIARKLGFQISVRESLRANYQSFAINAVLPGAIIGGDAWRALQLSRMAGVAVNGPEESKTVSAQLRTGVATVVLDRLSGLWAMGALALLGGVLSNEMIGTRLESDAFRYGWNVYLALCGLLAFLPAVLWIVAMQTWHAPTGNWARPIWSSFQAASGMSILAQGLIMLAWWGCLASVVDVPFWLGLATGAAIFVAGIIPTSIAGFGPREVGAAAVLVPLGISLEQAVMASLLFGLQALLQGLIGCLFFLCGDSDTKNIINK